MKYTFSIPLQILMIVMIVLSSCSEKRINEVRIESSETSLQPNFDPEDEILGLSEQWIGDLDGMIERGRIRALIPYNRTSYFINGTERGGIAYEALTLFEKNLNERLGKKPGKPGYVRIVFIPMTRDRILPSLKEGYGDIAAANLVITQKRKAEFDFSIPVLSNWKEYVVSGPAGRDLSKFDDLLGDTVHIRRSSSYFEHLQAFNDSIKKVGKQVIHVQPVDEYLEDDDILEMVNAGLIKFTISNALATELWEPLLEEIRVYPDLSIKSGGEIAWVMRPNSTGLKEVVNAFLQENREGSLIGNILLNKYLKNTNYLKKANSEQNLERFRELRGLFQKFGEQYNWDWLLLAAQGYQESQLDQTKKSSAGAVGIMQIKPSTAADPNVSVENVYDLENNIHAAAKYLNFLRSRYFDSPEIDPFNAMLMSLAAYNMGPGRMNGIRKKASEQGLNPNEWFGQLELLVASEVGREPVQYVSNIYKYYTSFRSLKRYGQITGKSIK